MNKLSKAGYLLTSVVTLFSFLSTSIYASPILPNLATGYITSFDSSSATYATNIATLNTTLSSIVSAKNTYSVSAISYAFNTKYGDVTSLVNTKSAIFDSKINQLLTTRTTLNTKYDAGQISASDYGVINNKIGKLIDTIQIEKINLGSTTSFYTANSGIVSRLTAKQTLLEAKRVSMIDVKTRYQAAVSTYNTTLTSFKSSPTTEKLDLLSSQVEAIDAITQEARTLDTASSVDIQDIINISTEATALTTAIDKYKALVTTLGNFSFDITTEVANITASINTGVAYATLKTQLQTDLNTSTAQMAEKTGIDKVLSKALVEGILSTSSNIAADGTTTGLTLSKIQYVVPVDGYLYKDSGSTLTQQNLFKNVYGIAGNSISNLGVELPSVSENGKTSIFSMTSPIKKVQMFSQITGLNVQNTQVFKIQVNYNDNVNYTLQTSLDLVKYNIQGTSNNTLDGIELTPGKYYVNIYLGSDKVVNDTNIVSLDNNITKRLYISILDSNFKSIFNKSITDVGVTTSKINSITIENLGGLKFNGLNIDYLNFGKGDTYRAYIVSNTIDFIGYVTPVYKALQDSIQTVFKTVDNKIVDSSGKIIGYKKTDVVVGVNKDQSTRTITYNSLKDISWSSINKRFNLSQGQYTVEQNVSIDPLLQTYLKIDRTPGFDSRFNDIRDAMTIQGKIEKIVRLRDASGTPIITEYRYFDSTQNSNASIADTTGKVLVWFRVLQVLEQGDKSKGIDRVENVFYKVGLDENYGKIVNTTNSSQLISAAGIIDNDKRPAFITVDPLLQYKVFNYYKLYFNKDAYLTGDVKNIIRYTKVYSTDLLKNEVVKWNGSVIGPKGAGLVFGDTVMN